MTIDELTKKWKKELAPLKKDYKAFKTKNTFVPRELSNQVEIINRFIEDLKNLKKK